MRVWGFWFWEYCCRSLFLGAVWLCDGLLARLRTWVLLGGFGRLKWACSESFPTLSRGFCLCWLMRASRNAVV